MPAELRIEPADLSGEAWVFHRPSGFSTAYVGSSNLTQSAQVTGLEWNVRVSQARNPDVVAKFGARSSCIRCRSRSGCWN